MIYFCQSCYYTYEAEPSDMCPDCGSAMIRPANEDEIAEYKAIKDEFAQDGA